MRQPVFAASLILALVLTATGAFGTFRLVLPVRLACWILITTFAAISLLVATRLRRILPESGWLRGIIEAAIAALPSTLLTGGLAALLLQKPISLSRVLALYPALLILTGSLVALWRLTARRDVLVEVAPRALADDTVPRAIASKLPPRLTRSRLVAVEAHDHYLRVATRDGEALVHMRFSDALAALRESDGTRVHRSWWVARGAIDEMGFANGRGELKLVDGTTVPVSRSFAAHAKEMARRPTRQCPGR